MIGVGLVGPSYRCRTICPTKQLHQWDPATIMVLFLDPLLNKNQD